MDFRHYGHDGPRVVLLHGGPGAPGYMRPIGERLGTSFQVWEPYQRRSTFEPLTVERHLDDLEAFLGQHLNRTKPVLVGHSWGAMLALAYAARHPPDTGPLVLVGCGTFDREARALLERNRSARIDAATKAKMRRLPKEIEDEDEQLNVLGELVLPAYSHDLLVDRLEPSDCDAKGHRESWRDMLRLQDEGVYPQQFERIEAPVLMLHGAVDPHPGELIRDGLREFVPQLDFFQWERCGHYPWLEREIQDDFYDRLERWLASK